MEDTVLEAIRHDEAYRVVRVLANSTTGSTELVCRDDEHTGALFVRKRASKSVASRTAWELRPKIACDRLPTVVDAYELPDQFVTVTRYVEGETLRDAISRNGPMVSESALRVASDVCRALEALHAHGIVHRDVTPGNILLTSCGALLIDLDNARIDGGGARDTNTLGTWGYAPPEQYGFASTDARSDIYSLGRVLAFAVTAIEPLDALSEERIRAALTTSPQLVDIARIVERACAFEPSRRFQRAAEMLSAMQGKWPAPPRDPRFDAAWRVALQGIVWAAACFWAMGLTIAEVERVRTATALLPLDALVFAAMGLGAIAWAWMFSRFIRGRGSFSVARRPLLKFLLQTLGICAAVIVASVAILGVFEG